MSEPTRKELMDLIKELTKKGDLKAAYELCDLYEELYPYTLDGPRHWLMLHTDYSKYLGRENK